MLIKKINQENNKTIKLNSSEIYDESHGKLLNNIISSKYLFYDIVPFTFNNSSTSDKNITLNESILDYDLLYVVIYQNGYGSGYIVDVDTLNKGIYLREYMLSHVFHFYSYIKKISDNQVQLHVEVDSSINTTINANVRIKGYKI